ncbi:MAG: 30S ribosomal protein S17 [SAR324 cluster bacterium]|nr:30S ribosomal protein S17 [SAR324 cluster bacterium]
MNKRTIEGVVVRDTKEKTGILLVERIVEHAKYRRTIKRTKKFHFHDVDNACKSGDKATIIESRRYSKTKSWRLLSIKGSKLAVESTQEVS